MLFGGYMSKSRREFLTLTSVGLIGVAITDNSRAQTPSGLPPGAPPAFGAGPAVGPEVSPSTFAEAQKLVQIEMTEPERAEAAGSWRANLAALYERRTGPRKIALETTLAPATQWNPVLRGMKAGPERDQCVRSSTDPKPLPADDEDIAFASVVQLSRWIEQRKLRSERLTQIYLKRLEQFDPKLRCVITLTRDLALRQAKQADAEIAAGKYRGPLHGIPCGVKDLLSTKEYKTTWGSVPFKDQMIDKNATVIKKLEEAGAVLLAKLSMGELAMDDVWYGGMTRNPWNYKEGSSGSSAGSASATSAGLVAFAIGTETWGSIVSPSSVCGTTGLRPTYGRVSRTGAMTLAWSMDKIGPICRTVEDCALVFN